MGAINKHPSCSLTWELTTKTSLAVSRAFSAAMQANVSLEHVLLTEFRGHTSSTDVEDMLGNIKLSCSSLAEAKELLQTSVELGEGVGNPYIGDFKSLNIEHLASNLDRSVLHDCREQVLGLGHELKQDHLSTARRFVTSLIELEALAQACAECLETAASYAQARGLKASIEEGLFPLQRVYASYLSAFLVFMKEYLVDSLIATEVVFVAGGRSLVVAD